jgi:oligo-1,6-glucosidase
VTGIAGGERRAWWRSAVVYQVYPRSFSDADGDGIGDLRGLLGRLDHLERLGVDVVWLSPIYRSPQRDNGYDISDYRAIDPVFGTLDDFDELLAELHRRGIKLVMDLVVNHTSDAHPWFVESRSSPDSAKRDWYWWRPPRPGLDAGEPGAEPTNWSSFFGGPTWTLDERTGEYYLHLFSPGQPDLNWENREVRAAVYELMRWWLDRGVDGFRMDVINMISKNPALPDGPAAPGALLGDGFAHYANGPRLHEFLQEMHREVFAGRDGRLLTVGEMPGVTAEEAALFTDPRRGELDMVFQFEHVSLDHDWSKFAPRPLDLRELKTTLGRWQRVLGEVGWNSLYWSNHDQPRIVSRFGDDREHWALSATMLATVLHLQRGTPYVYQGEELGMTNAPFADIEEFQDVETLGHYAVAVAAGRAPAEVLAGIRAMGRDNARTPMQWNASRAAGFTAGVPWLPVNPNHTWLNAAAQYDDPHSVFNHYRKLIELRHRDAVVVDGDFTMLLEDDEHVYAFARRLGDRELLVLGNFTGQVRPVDIAREWDGASLLLGNYADPAAEGDDAVPALRPWEARVYERDLD